MRDFLPKTDANPDDVDPLDQEDLFGGDLLGEDVTDPNAPQMVLVVDDSRLQRKLLTTSLKKWGYDVLEASSGAEGLALVKEHNISMVISDWIMPGMNGPEFCHAFRQLDRREYGYFVLLTSKSDSQEVTQGLNSGADDFLTKPVSFGELKARLRAGERIVRMQSQLVEKNRVVNRAFDEIKSLYESLDKDLEEARKLQQSLVRETRMVRDGGEAAFLLLPSGHVGGDLVGHFPVDKDTIGLFSLDVSGHGVSSALMTARLAGHLSGRTAAQNIALREEPDGSFTARDPAETASLLNELLLREFDTDLYFTMALCILNSKTGVAHMVQAGHPHPYLLAEGKLPEILGTGGMPIGLIPGAEFESFSLQMEPGDRLILHSDGITECADPEGDLLENEGFLKFLEQNRQTEALALLDKLPGLLRSYSKRDGFEDDVSALIFDFTGAPS